MNRVPLMVAYCRGTDSQGQVEGIMTVPMCPHKAGWGRVYDMFT